MDKPAAVITCKSYEAAEVDAALTRALDLLGGVERFFSPGQKVLIKANLMRKSAPEQCCVTHPAIVGGIARLAMERGAEVTICDSPGGLYNGNVLKQVYRATGYEAMAAECGASLNQDFSYTDTLLDGVILKHIDIINPVLEADVIVDAAKLKTHAHATYTGAAKNMFGCVPGLEKAELHFNHRETESFANAILDIVERVKPDLAMIDAVMAMEGNGPGSGEPRFVGAIVASEDMYSADLAAMALANISPEEVPMMREAQKRGLTDLQLNAVGDSLEDLIVPDFKRSDFVDNNVLRGRVPGCLSNILQKWLALKPVIDKQKCIGCGVCRDVCPSKTIVLRKKKVRIYRKPCVKCFCCQEFCPQKAIAGKRNKLISAVISITKDRG